MSNKTKIISMLLLVVMLMSMLAACASGNKTNNSGSTEPAPPSGTATDATENTNDATKEPFEVTMAMPVFGAIPKDMEAVQAEINKITKEKINTTVKILPISIGAWGQQMNLMTSGAEKLDMYFAFGVAYASDVALGKAAELDGLMEQYGQDLKKQFDPDYLKAAMINGKTYGVPIVKDYTIGNQGIVMRKDLVEKHNIDVASIKTIEDLDAIFQTIKNNEPSIAPLGVGITIPTDTYFKYDKLGNRLGVLPGYDNGLKVENLFELQEYEDLLNILHRWFKAGYITKDAATSQVPGLELMKANKTFAYFFNNKPGGVERESRMSGKDLVFVPLLSESYATTGDVIAGLWSISSNSTNPERTMMFMNLMYSDPAIANLLLWGVEGQHYVKVSENVIDYPSGIEAGSVGYANLDWLIGNSFMTYVFKTDLQDKWQLSAEANANAKKSKALGFAFDAEPVKNEITAINNVVEQYAKGLETGTLNPADKLAEFRAKLKAAGIDKVIAEKQKQLDAWAAANK